MGFAMPTINDNKEGWGPGTPPEKFDGMPYAPFEKRAFIGRMADWSARAEQYRERMRNRPAAVTNEAFTFTAEDTEGFNLVDTQKAMPQPGWDRGMRGRGRGRFGGRFGGRGGGKGGAQPMGAEAKFNAKFNAKKAPQAPVSKWKKNQAANFANRWNEQKQPRVRESAVDVRPEWTVRGQITFQELAKMTMDVPDSAEVHSCGTVSYYDKQYDRCTPKSDKKLERVEERAFYKVSTSDDPIIARLHDEPAHSKVRVFATDAILAVLMAAGRSSYSWDIVVNRVGDKLFLDKRADAPIDYVTCNETAHDTGDEDRDSMNHPAKLMQEATFINQNFSQQVLSKTDEPLKFTDPKNPFAEGSEDVPAPVGYKYRVFKLGKAPKGDEADSRLQLLCRTEIDGVIKGKNEADPDLLMRLYALNETDAKLVAGGIDWRQKLESQRGAVLATELKNNSNKLAKWTLQAMLAGVDLIKLGYVSRNHVRDSFNHVILGTQSYKPKEFATHINLNVNNSWGILKAVIDLCLQLEEGKYLLLKDPNKPVIRFFAIPPDAFEEPEEVGLEEGEGEEED